MAMTTTAAARPRLRRHIRAPDLRRDLGCDARTLAALIEAGKLPRPIKLSSHVVLFDLEEVEEALRRART